MFWRKTSLIAKPTTIKSYEGVKRVHYQFILWKSAPDINPEKPMPDNYGWNRDCDKYISVMTTLPPNPEAPL